MSEVGGDKHYRTKSGVVIDPQLMDINETLFKPFNIDSPQSLRKALNDGAVTENTNLIGIELPGEKMVALTAKQLSYHHVAQGELDGEPWMITF